MVELLPETTRLLYAELLEQSIHASAEAAAEPLPPGSIVEKKIRGRSYWYVQTSAGRYKKQHYLGADSPALRTWIKQTRETKSERAVDASSRSRLAGMLASGGAATVSPALLRVFELLDEARVFHWGGVLIGTHAFGTYGNMLGARWTGAALRTQDIDIAQDSIVGVGLRADAEPVDVPQVLAQSDLGFFAIPTLDPRQPSTSFRIRGQELRVDFLTPLRGPERTKPIFLPSLRVAAQPLRMLDYLIDDSLQALIIGSRDAVLVNVPQPARFALHKLWTSTRRAAAFQSKAQKDLAQAAVLIDFLSSERPFDLESAAAAIGDRPKVRRKIFEVLPKLEDHGTSTATIQQIAELVDT